MPFVVKFEHRHATLYLLTSPLHDSNVVCVGIKRIIFAGREKTDKRYVYKTLTIDVSPTPGDKDGTELKMYYTTWTTRNACLSSSYRCTIVYINCGLHTCLFIRVIVVIFNRYSRRNAPQKILNDAIIPVELYKFWRATDFQSHGSSPCKNSSRTNNDDDNNYQWMYFI